MATYFFTGFPGFIATQLMKKIVSSNKDAQFYCLVHPTQVKKAEAEVQRFQELGVQKEQFQLLPGDITVDGLGLSEELSQQLRSELDYVFHLAAIYDLAVPKDLAYRVNVLGTKHVNEWVRQFTSLKRYVYFSTAYVSGTRTGRIYETELAMGQGFKNYYELTKYEAEVLVQEMMDHVPTTIIRPGITMGNSHTGETIKFDGPYFIMRFLDKFAHFPIPYIGRGEAYVNIVPIDYVVDATTYLSHADVGVGKVYHLTDPKPYLARDAYRMIVKALLGKEPSYTISDRLIYAALSIPSFRRWVGVERETIEYFRLRAEYDATQAVQDLANSGIRCPDFADYVPVVTAYYQQHRHDEDKRIHVK